MPIQDFTEVLLSPTPWSISEFIEHMQIKAALCWPRTGCILSEEANVGLKALVFVSPLTVAVSLHKNLACSGVAG